MGDTAVTSFRSEHGEGHIIVAPTGEIVFKSVAGGVDVAITKVPIETHAVAKFQCVALYLEEDGTIGFRP